MRGALSFPRAVLNGVTQLNDNPWWSVRPDRKPDRAKRSFAATKLFDQTFSARLQTTKIGLQIGYLAHFIQQGNTQKVTPIAAGLREILWESEKSEY